MFFGGPIIHVLPRNCSFSLWSMCNTSVAIKSEDVQDVNRMTVNLLVSAQKGNCALRFLQGVCRKISGVQRNGTILTKANKAREAGWQHTGDTVFLSIFSVCLICNSGSEMPSTTASEMKRRSGVLRQKKKNSKLEFYTSVHWFLGNYKFYFLRLGDSLHTSADKTPPPLVSLYLRDDLIKQ